MATAAAIIYGAAAATAVVAFGLRSEKVAAISVVVAFVSMCLLAVICPE